MKKKILFYIIFTLIYSILFILFFSNCVFAAYPKLVTTMLNAFITIKNWLIKVATPAAAVAVRHWCIYEKI